MKSRELKKRFVTSVVLGSMVLGNLGGLPMVFAEEAPGISAFAVGTYTTVGGIATFGNGAANISINGNTDQTLVGKKFNVYRLFNAENAVAGESINYTFNPDYKVALQNIVSAELGKTGTAVLPTKVTEYQVIDYIQTLNTNPVEGAQANQILEGSYSKFRIFIEALRDEMVKVGSAPDIVNVTNTRSDNSVRLTGLPFGYFIVDEVSLVEGEHKASSLCMVNTSNPTANIGIKSDYPRIIKKIKEDDGGNGITDPDRWNDIADYEIGQTVPYKYESNISNMNGYDKYYYAWHDVMDKALTFKPDSVAIEISGKAGGVDKTYQLTKAEFAVNTTPGNGETFVVAVDDIKTIVDREFNQMNSLSENIYGQKVTLRYDATLNDLAADDTGRPGFENDVRLEFSNDPDSDHKGSTGYTPWDTVVCFTYKLNGLKVNDHDLKLENAKFRLYSDEACTEEVYVKKAATGYHVINRDIAGGTDHTGGAKPTDAVEMVSDAQGVFNIIGLDSGVYYLKETGAPAGYRPLLDPIKLDLKATITADRDLYIKGDGATEKTLQKLEVSAKIKEFYSGAYKESDNSLITDINEGSSNLTVVNQVGLKLPITGSSTMLIIICLGASLMAIAFVMTRKKNSKQKNDEK